MIDAGYNYDRRREDAVARYSTGKYQRIIITHQDTVGAIEVDSQGLFKTAKIYVGRVGRMTA